MSEPLSGRCLCGAVRYQCGPALYSPTMCHCESCRRASGAHAVGWVTVAKEGLVFSATPPREYESTPGVYRSFCGRCGAPLTYRSARRSGEIDLTIGSLDQAAQYAPNDHIWMQDALPWDRPGDTLPQYPAARTGPG